jgi:hypothetical protein
MGRTEIAGFRPKSYKNLQAKARETTNFSNEIRDFRIFQAELKSFLYATASSSSAQGRFHVKMC